METTLPLFDLMAAREARAAALVVVGRDGDLKAWALRVVERVARAQPAFTTDDVYQAEPALETAIAEKRLMGSVMRHAQKNGWIDPAHFVDSDRVISHGRPKRLWLSKLKSV